VPVKENSVVGQFKVEWKGSLLFTTETGDSTRLEYYSTLCAPSVLSPVSVVNINLLYTQLPN
jgi:hypothetical protein